MTNVNEWTPSTWSQKLEGFCESKLNTEIEFGNTLSCVFILYWGIYGLYQLPSPIYQNAQIWQIVFSLLICIGIGSTGFHSTLSIGWALYDSIPMLLCEFIALFQLISMGFKIKIHNKQQENKAFSNHKCYEFFSKLFGIFIIAACIFTIVINSVYGGTRSKTPRPFTTTFTAVTFCFGGTGIWAAILLRKKIKNQAGYKLIFRHLAVGCLVAIFAGIMRDISMRLCDNVEVVKYLPIHGIWHVAISFGMYCLAQVAIFIDFDITIHGNNMNGFKVYLMTREDGKSKLQRIWYMFVPVLRFNQIAITKPADEGKKVETKVVIDTLRYKDVAAAELAR